MCLHCACVIITVMWGEAEAHWLTFRQPAGYTWMIFGLLLKSRVCWTPASCRSQLMGMWSRRFMSKCEKWTWEPAERRNSDGVKENGGTRKIEIEGKLRETGKLTWSCNDCSTLLMQITLEVECRTSHGPPYTLHLAHKDARLHMRTRVGFVHKNTKTQLLINYHSRVCCNGFLQSH